MKIGKIYKIICAVSDDVYVGSTFNTLRDRFSNHKSAFKNDKNLAIISYFKQYGIENFKIILIKEYEVIDRAHLESKEQLWINKLKCVNLQSAFRIGKLTDKLHNQDKIKEYYKEYYKNNQNNIKEYRLNNQDKIKEKTKEYRLNNQDKIKEKNKEYRLNNQDKIKEKNKEYYKNNQDNLKEYRLNNQDKIKQYKLNNQDKIKEYKKEYNKTKIKCETCNCEISKSSLSRHNKSKKHINNSNKKH